MVVIADNCTDETARVARDAGAVVVERHDPRHRGKGYALAHIFRWSREDNQADAVVVVDADSKASANLLESFAARIERGNDALQAHYGVLNANASWRTRLMAIALGSIHKLRSRARERLGLSCGIRGNGWCVTHALLDAIPYQAYSLTEDVEFGIALGLAGHRVAYCDEAYVNGEMVTTESAARSQRQRWESGRLRLIYSKVPVLLRRAAVGRSLVCLDLALDLLILPLSYIVLSVAAMLAVAIALSLISRSTFHLILLGVAAADCAALAAYVCRGWVLSGIACKAYGTCCMCRASFSGKCCCWFLVQRPPPGSEPGGRSLNCVPTAVSPAKAMKNIVLVSGNRIAPAATGGQVRSIGIARALARLGHSVHIFSTAGRREDYQGANLRRGMTMESVIEPRLKESTHLGLTFGIMQSLARRLDYPRAWQHHMLSRGMVPKQLKQALREADIVLSDLPYCPPIPGPWRGKPWYLISHNLEHKLLEQGSARQRRFSGWMRGIEGAAPQTYTDILSCAEEDQAFFRAHDSRSQLRLPIVRCGVDPGIYSFSPEMRPQVRTRLALTEEDRVLIFSGSGFGPNVEAFQEIKKFWPRGSRIPGAEPRLLPGRRIGIPPALPRGRPHRDGTRTRSAPLLRGQRRRHQSGNPRIRLQCKAVRVPGGAVAGHLHALWGTGDGIAAVRGLCAVQPPRPEEAIRQFIGSDRTSWRIKAEDVWNRHRRSCDIQELMNDAISVLPPFAS